MKYLRTFVLLFSIASSLSISSCSSNKEKYDDRHEPDDPEPTPQWPGNPIAFGQIITNWNNKFHIIVKSATYSSDEYVFEDETVYSHYIVFDIDTTIPKETLKGYITISYYSSERGRTLFHSSETKYISEQNKLYFNITDDCLEKLKETGCDNFVVTQEETSHVVHYYIKGFEVMLDDFSVEYFELISYLKAF